MLTPEERYVFGRPDILNSSAGSTSVISGCAGPPAAWQVNLNERTPELERAHLGIRHPPAGRQRVRPTQLTLSDPRRGEQPTADRVVSAE
jgi:hypothetical protein